MFKLIKHGRNILQTDVISQFSNFLWGEHLVPHVDGTIYSAIYDDVHTVLGLSKTVQNFACFAVFISQKLANV